MPHEEHNPLVSIVFPSFNSADSIERGIRAVLGQTYENIELIVIDGGSTDGTVDIIKQYEDNIAYWVSEPDQGTSHAFSKGVRRAHGEIVGVTNCDDWYEVDAVEAVVAAWRNSGADFYVGAVRYWEDDRHTFVRQPDPDFAQKIMYRMPAINQEAMFVHHSVYDDIGLYDTELVCTSDYEFTLRMVQAEKQGKLINKVLANKVFGGITDEQAPIAYREVFQNAPDKSRALIWMLYSATKFHLRQLIDLFPGSARFIHFIRNMKYDTKANSSGGR